MKVALVSKMTADAVTRAIETFDLVTIIDQCKMEMTRKEGIL